MDSVKLFKNQEVKVRTDEEKILVNLIHVAKCCGLTRKDKGYELIRWKANGSVTEKLKLIFDTNVPKEFKQEISYVLDEIENINDRNTIYISTWLAKRLAVECHSKKANEFKNWLVTLDECSGKDFILNQNTITTFVSKAMESTINQMADVIIPEINKANKSVKRAEDLVNKQLEQYKKDREKLEELNGLKTSHIRTITEKIKFILSSYIGVDVLASSKPYRLAKNKIFSKFNVCKWEDLSTKYFNDVCNYIDNILMDDIINDLISLIEKEENGSSKNKIIHINKRRKNFVKTRRKTIEVMEIDGKRYIKCSKCGKIKELTEKIFYKSPDKPIGFIATCKECKKDYYKLNRKERLTYQNNYQHYILGVIHRSDSSYNKGLN